MDAKGDAESMRKLYSVAVRADLSTGLIWGQPTFERVIQSGVVVAESDEEASMQARQAATKRYPELQYSQVRVHISRVPDSVLRELVAGRALRPNTLEDPDA
jgi:hypothetical protein